MGNVNPEKNTSENVTSEETNARSNFIWDAIDRDLEDKRYTEVHTRFPRNPTDICISAIAKP